MKTSEEVREEQRKKEENSKQVQSTEGKKHKDGNFQLYHHVNRVSADAKSASDIFAFLVRQETTIHIVINNKT